MPNFKPYSTDDINALRAEVEYYQHKLATLGAYQYRALLKEAKQALYAAVAANLTAS